MGIVVVSVVVALVVAVVVAGIVVVGMRGELPEVSEKAPELAGRFEWAARHLNGDAAPSSRMVDLERAVSRLRHRDGVADAVGVQPAALPAAEEFGRA